MSVKWIGKKFKKQGLIGAIIETVKEDPKSPTEK
jgi:hypothetical protein